MTGSFGPDGHLPGVARTVAWRWRSSVTLNVSVDAASGELSEEARDRLADLAATRDYAAGEVVLREDEPVPFLGVVDAGRVALRVHVPGRGRVTIVTVEPRELVGWSAVVPPFRATAEAVAVEATRLVTYDATLLRTRLQSDPEVCAAVMPALLVALSDRLTTSWHQLLDLFGGQAAEPW